MQKFKISITLATLASSVLIFTHSANAEWILIEDFEDFADGTDMTGYFPVFWGGGGLPEFWVYAEDINDPESNKGYFVDWGSNASGGSDTFVSIPLLEYGGQEVPEGSYLSAYFRLYKEGYSNKFHFGTTMKKEPIAGTDPVEYRYNIGWSDHNTIFRYTPGGLFGAHSGGYFDTVPEFYMDLFEWYEFCLIQNNSTVKAEKQWRVYYRGPGETEWNLMTFNPEDPISLLNFRNTDNDSIKALVISTNNDRAAPNNRDLWLIDDIYVNIGDSPVIGDPRSGETLAVDFASGEIGGDNGGDAWGGYPIENTDGDVNTGDWLGWINVAGEPYVYSYSLGWIFMTEPEPEAPGSWIYIPR